jgi:hypothetical protein
MGSTSNLELQANNLELHTHVRLMEGMGITANWHMVGIGPDRFLRGRIISTQCSCWRRGTEIIVELIQQFGLYQMNVHIRAEPGRYPNEVLGGRLFAGWYSDRWDCISYTCCSLTQLENILLYFHRRRLV